MLACLSIQNQFSCLFRIFVLLELKCVPVLMIQRYPSKPHQNWYKLEQAENQLSKLTNTLTRGYNNSEPCFKSKPSSVAEIGVSSQNTFWGKK